MKTSAIKIIQLILDKKNINKLKKFSNIRNLLIICAIFTLILLSTYLIRPIFFSFDTKNEIIEKKLSSHLKIQTKIKGNITYKFLPIPKIKVENLELTFDKSKPVLFKESDILISIFKLGNLEDLKIKKIRTVKQKIQIYPKDFNKYLKYAGKKNINKIFLKKCEIFFVDNQNTEIPISNFNFKNNIRNNGEKISIDGTFSGNNFKLNFINNKTNDKFLNLKLNELSTSLKIKFNKESTLEKNSGNLKLKVLNNILMLNFSGGEIYKIDNSYFRNKFLNSKLNGDISFKDNFFFNLNLLINQINFRKLFLYYNSFPNKNISKNINFSKKINGKINLSTKKTDSFLGKIENIKMKIIFENGNIKIQNASAILPGNSLINFNLSLLDKGKDQNIKFFLNFISENKKNFFRKFNLNLQEGDLSLSASGRINILKKSIQFQNIFLNKANIDKNKILIVQKSFNENIIKDSIWDIIDYFRIKKFINDVYERI